MNLSIEEIARAVSWVSNLPLDLIRGRDRTRNVSDARLIIIGLAREAGFPLRDIGQFLGRGVSTISLCHASYEALKKTDPSFALKVKDAQDFIRNGGSASSSV